MQSTSSPAASSTETMLSFTDAFTYSFIPNKAINPMHTISRIKHKTLLTADFFRDLIIHFPLIFSDSILPAFSQEMLPGFRQHSPREVAKYAAEFQNAQRFQNPQRYFGIHSSTLDMLQPQNVPHLYKHGASPRSKDSLLFIRKSAFSANQESMYEHRDRLGSPKEPGITSYLRPPAGFYRSLSVIFQLFSNLSCIQCFSTICCPVRPEWDPVLHLSVLLLLKW